MKRVKRKRKQGKQKVFFLLLFLPQTSGASTLLPNSPSSLVLPGNILQTSDSQAPLWRQCRQAAGNRLGTEDSQESTALEALPQPLHSDSHSRGSVSTSIGEGGEKPVSQNGSWKNKSEFSEKGSTTNLN